LQIRGSSYNTILKNGKFGANMEILQELGLAAVNAGAFAGYAWRASEGKQLVSSNPATEKPLASVAMASVDDYETVVKKSRQAYLTWREVPPPIRGECIRLIAEELRAKKSLLGKLISLECGKIIAEGEGEVQEMIDIADFAVGLSRMLYGKTMPSERKNHRMFEQWLPLGPIGVITAFNFPVAVWAWNAFIAAVCGDTIIWKPSDKVPLCAVATQLICNNVMKRLGYDGVFSLIITNDVVLAEQMVADERLPLISFTGSTAVGRKIARIVAGRLGRSILELSGNNAVIVDETADFRLAIPAIVFGAVGTAGQRCTSTRRVIVHESRAEALTKELVVAYQQVKIGNPTYPDTLMGPLIDDSAVQNYRKTIAEIRQLHGKILFGGEVLDGPGHYVLPTLVRAESNWQVLKEETFAPILYILPFETFAEAIEIHNNVAQGLSSALFTENLKNSEDFLSARGSDCGIANVNIGTSGAEIGGAFGGEKDTGGGREAGSDAWKSYMRRQTNTINSGHELPLAQGIRFYTPPSKVAP
jgi:aldehyde dehydrogenase (NAD+)